MITVNHPPGASYYNTFAENFMLRSVIFTTILFLITSTVFSQTGNLTGKITDETNNQPLTRATVKIIELSRTFVAESDGTYHAGSIKPGKYSLEVSFVGYLPKKITEAEILAGQVTTVNISLTPQGSSLSSVTVTTVSAKRENLNSLLITRRNAAVVSDGISADMIKRSPDKNTSDVLKRVSGTSVQDNKYVVVRGMNDRYNEALLNGIILPSSEPDRKTFAFDIFPSEVVDNITIYKSASPELPGSFAGGLVQVTTKDIPDRSFFSLKVAGGFNSKTASNDFYTYPGGNTDWLGYDNRVRVLPTQVAQTSTHDFNQLKYDNPDAKTALDRSFSNNWAIYKKPFRPLNNSMQFTGGFNQKLNENSNYPKLGGIFSVTYSSAYTYGEQDRVDYAQPADQSIGINYHFLDTQYIQNILASALGNIALKINANNKIFFNNIISMNSFDQTIVRGGSYEAVSRPFVHAYSYYFVSNRLSNSQLGGEHVIGKTKIKLNWSVYYTDLQRKEPDYRYMIYTRDNEDVPFNAVLAYGGALATTESGLRFYGAVEDYNKGGNTDISVPFNLFDLKQTLKVGAGYYYDFRRRNIRFFNTNQPDKYTAENSGYLYEPIESIFNKDHFKTKTGFYYNEPELNTNGYFGHVRNASAFIMMDNKLSKKLRLVWGVRVEDYKNILEGLDAAFEPTVFADIKKTDWLPSANIIYNILPKANLRGSYSKTVTRPLFRELSPQVFYDFFINITYTGNPNLVPTYIDNYEVRWEHFFTNAQYYSVSLFYKKLKNPIEPVAFNQSAESLQFGYGNSAEAKNKGIELEIRKDFSFIGKGFENLSIYANGSFVQSEISARDIAYAKDSTRPLFGQSPFIINASLQYAPPKSGLGFSLLFNQAGTRLWLLNGLYDNIIWEKPRPILDAKISKGFMKNKGSLEFSWGDILHRDAIFFNDVDGNQRYDEGVDAITIKRKFGYTMSFALGYRF